MRLNKPYTNKEYADFASYCNNRQTKKKPLLSAENEMLGLMV